MRHNSLLALLLAAIGLPFVPVCAQEAPARPGSTDFALRQMMDAVRILERLQEVRLTPEQAQAALPWLKKAEAIRQQVQPFEEETLRALQALIDKARAEVAAGQALSPVLRREIESKFRELEERRQQVRAQGELAAWAVFNALTPDQAAVLMEPDWRRMLRMRLSDVLDDLRTLPAATFEQGRLDFLRVLWPEGRAQTEEARAKVSQILAQARALDEAEYAKQKRTLIDGILAAVPGPEWPARPAQGQTEAERQEAERLRAVRTLADMLMAPGIAEFLQARAAAK